MRRLLVEMAGTGGTSLGKFTRKKDAARLSRTYEGSDAWWIWSADSGDAIGYLRPADKGWAGYSLYEPTGETSLEYHGPDFMAAVSAVLGKPGYGYSWYRVKR
jgi:hypothetical protein